MLNSLLRLLFLAPLLVTPSGGLANQILATPTFECVGLSWKPDGDQNGLECQVRYRKSGAEQGWRSGYPLWWDAETREYRGSVVNLTPGTEFEFELSNGAASVSKKVATWSESFPIGKVVELPAASHETLRITESGSSEGYVLYTFIADGEAVIDVQQERESCVEINASYVILRGLTLKNAVRHGVRLFAEAHDVVIEECEITNWGRVGEDGFGLNPDAAIFAGQKEGGGIHRLIIQRNRIHHPRSDANSWEEYRAHRQSYHPEGAHGIYLFNTAGNHVIRYNSIWSDENHRFNDIIGGGENYSKVGSPNRDSDIYGNHLSHCWDDAIEAEGANENVRIWGNYLDHSFVKIATATTSVGPLYIWRNVAAHSRKSDLRGVQSDRGGFLKTSDRLAAGRIYLFHNTVLQPTSLDDSGLLLGSDPGLGHGGNMRNVTTRNNILHIANSLHSSILDRDGDSGSSYDFDLYNGNLGNARVGSEENGIQGVPTYVNPMTSGDFSLAPDSPGFDAGLVLPNFSDNYTGKAPDMGAQEANSPILEFGHTAYLNEN